MSTYSSNRNHRRCGGLYRDRENSWLFGVCAGLAEFANFRTGTVRVLALISLLLFFWPTVLIYGAAALLLKERPLIYAGRNAEYEFWRCRGHRGRWTHP
jgi:phage shock protein PspC (stress-responsive transcriptional regulator)